MISPAASVGDVRIAIGDAVGQDIADRVNTTGNSRAAVSFQRETLVAIAYRVPDRTGDCRDPEDLSCHELKQYIARQLDVEPPNEGSHFTWLHLRAIADELEVSV